MQRRFEIEEIQRYLRLVDAELAAPCEIVLVGGAALALGYCPAHSVEDIELWRASRAVIWTAAERASEKIPRPIRLRQAMADEPRHAFEDRAWPIPLEGTKHLKVLVPEAHDQVLLRAARGEPLEALATLHRERPLALPTLVERYEEMKREVSGPRSRFRASFLASVGKLFGEAKAQQVGQRIKE